MTEVDVDTLFWIIAEFHDSGSSIRGGSDQKVLCGTTQANEEMVVIRVDDACTT